jgi:hypothetical protein
MPPLPSLRASDADREHVAERLRHATAEGRLTADELEDRLAALFAAKTYGELDALVADLPVPRSRDRGRLEVPRWVWGAGAAMLLLPILGMLTAVGHHADEAFDPSRFGRHGNLPGRLADSHHAIVGAASTFTVLMLIAIAVTATWLLRSKKAPSA